MTSIFDRAGDGIWTAREADGQYTIGTPFKVTFAGGITHLRWRRHNSSGDAPSGMDVYDTSGSIVVSAASIPDGGTAGWKDCPLADTWRPALNTEYRVVARNPASSGLSVAPAVGSLAAPAGLAFAQAGRAYHTAPPYVYPDAIEATTWEAVDVLYVPDSPPPPPASTGDVDADLASWLSSNSATQTHETDGLPWKTYAEVTDGTHGLAKLWDKEVELYNKVLDLLSRVPDTLAASVTLVLRSLGLSGSPINSSVSTASGETAMSRLASLAANLNNLANLAGALRNLPPVPGDGWALADSTTFDNMIAWGVPADLYTLVVDPVTANRPVTSVDGAPWRPRLGWWAVRNGDFFGGRQYVEFDHAHLIDQGRRMPGVVIWLEPPSSGTLEAWTYAPA